LPSDHWYSEVFRAMPDLVFHLLPGLACAGTGSTDIPAAANSAAVSSSGPEPEPPRETAYIFRPVALKKVAHYPDGVLWPRQHPGGSDAYPVVLLEVQICDVTWVDLQALACQPDLDPMLALLTLPVQKEPDLGPCAQRIVALRPDLIELIVPILSERFQGLTPSQIMATLGISKDFWRHTRAFQDILAEGRQEGVELGRKEGVELGRQEGLQVGLQEGRQEGHQEGRELGLEEGLEEGRRREACTLALRLLERRCGTLSAATNSGIEVLSRAQLENLTLALLDFRSVEDLQIWLEQLEA